MQFCAAGSMTPSALKRSRIRRTFPTSALVIALLAPACVRASADPISPISIPFKFDLFQSGKSSLSFNTLFQYNASVADAKETPLLSSLDWVGNTRLLSNSTLTTGLYLDLRGGDWLDRSGVSVAEKSKLKYADMSLQFSRAGTQFLQGKAAGLTPGQEIAEFLTTLHPTSTMSINTTLRDTTTLVDPAYITWRRANIHASGRRRTCPQSADEHKDSSGQYCYLGNNAGLNRDEHDSQQC